VGAVVNIIGKNPDKDSVRGYVSYGSRYTWKNGINLSKKVDEKWSVGFGYENKQTDGWMKKYSYARYIKTSLKTDLFTDLRTVFVILRFSMKTSAASII